MLFLSVNYALTNAIIYVLPENLNFPNPDFKIEDINLFVLFLKADPEKNDPSRILSFQKLVWSSYN